MHRFICSISVVLPPAPKAAPLPVRVFAENRFRFNAYLFHIFTFGSASEFAMNNTHNINRLYIGATISNEII